MRNLSVTTFITILFSVVMVVLIVTFLFFLSWDNDRQMRENVKRYKLISVTFISSLQRSPDDVRLQKLYKDVNVLPLDEHLKKNIVKEIQNTGKTIFTGDSPIGLVRVFNINKGTYIYVQRMGYNLMLKDNESNKNFKYNVAGGLLLILLFMLVYLAVLKKLSPLKKLHEQIENFAQGDMKTHIDYIYDDEVGAIAKSFNHAIEHINELSASKNLFMRNLMHELKTPLTKGRIVVEMIEDKENKKILVRAFDRMNELITELVALERVTMRSFEPQLESCMLSEVVKESLELLMVQGLTININDISLKTDKKLLALVLKNLFDNAMKYGVYKSIRVQNNQYSIEISSKGSELEYPLSFYTEPFTQGEKRSFGFGLGLYIVHSILQKLHYTLEYEHREGENVFIIILAVKGSS